MTTLIIATMAAAVVPADTPLMALLVERVRLHPGFTIESKGDRQESSRCDLVLRRQADGASIKFNLSWARNNQVAAKSWVEGRIVSTLVNPATFSGMPLGHNLHSSSTSGGIGIYARAGVYNSHVSISAYPSAPGNPPSFTVSDREGDQQIIEGLARFSLAAANGLVAAPSEPIGVSGAQVPTLLGPEGGRLVDLQSYCLAKGTTAIIDLLAGKATTTYAGRDVLVPLGSTKVLAGQEWFESNDITVVRDGRWFVPLANLQAAMRD
jgi:hypothetical protein